VPFPADYGGAIDVFYKLKALNDRGIKIILHAFEYGNRIPSKELEKYCEKVFYYKRSFHLGKFINKLPFIVCSRKNEELLKNLKAIDAPIFFEGLHTTFYLNHPDLKNRFKMVRIHNIEHEYYKHLSINEEKPLKKRFFKQESKKLKQYEKVLQHAQVLFAISKTEQAYYKKHFKINTVDYLPAFHPFEFNFNFIKCNKYILYHGNLSVSENIKAVEWILKNIAPKIKHPIIIAGKNPSDNLKREISNYQNVELNANPTFSEMEQLVKNAHIHLLITHQSTGIKLKLLAALFSGKHCLVNDDMVKGTGLENLCEIGNEPAEFIKKINILMEREICKIDLMKIKDILQKKFNNTINVIKILNSL
jgi:hypothetical protein